MAKLLHKDTVRIGRYYRSLILFTIIFFSTIRVLLLLLMLVLLLLVPIFLFSLSWSETNTHILHGIYECICPNRNEFDSVLGTKRR